MTFLSFDATFYARDAGISPAISIERFPRILHHPLENDYLAEKAKNSKISRKSMQKYNNWVNVWYKSDLK